MLKYTLLGALFMRAGAELAGASASTFHGIISLVIIVLGSLLIGINWDII